MSSRQVIYLEDFVWWLYHRKKLQDNISLPDQLVDDFLEYSKGDYGIE